MQNCTRKIGFSNSINCQVNIFGCINEFVHVTVTKLMRIFILVLMWFILDVYLSAKHVFCTSKYLHEN